ncbi:MAG: A/G-specific adenine glycosylase [Clostridia bacterium]|nr:A/G-specific adenine glycosylase [Clostridia bacterium]
MLNSQQLKNTLPVIAAFFEREGRPLPWRADRDPYHVWLSEIMLQQTRVEAVIPYYQRFLSVFPTVLHLAEAEEELLYKCWEGLGYYSRARNLKQAALTVAEAGRFPNTYEGLLTLKGVGEYTAGAIASICYGLPTPAVDGNVLRILARLFAIEEPVTTPSFKRRATEALVAVYPSGEDAGRVTQGFMEIGQRFCLPNGAPKCETCPLRPHCQVGKEGGYDRIPARTAKKERKIQKRTVLLLLSEQDGSKLVLRKRPDEGLLAGLWEFPGIEGHLTDVEAFAVAKEMGFAPTGAVASLSATHVFTHIEWHMISYVIPVSHPLPKGFVLASADEMAERYPIASAFRSFKEFAVKLGNM